MRGYPTHRQAPQGYKAVTKPLAKALFEQGVDVTLAGNNVNSFHIFDGWHLGCTMNLQRMADGYMTSFDAMVDNFLWHLDRELGTYAVYYVPQATLIA